MTHKTPVYFRDLAEHIQRDPAAFLGERILPLVEAAKRDDREIIVGYYTDYALE